MNTTEPGDAAERPATSKVPGGVSPRLAILAAAGLLITVVAVGVTGRQPVAPLRSQAPASAPAVAQASATPLPVVSASPRPSVLPAASYPIPPVPPLFMHWEPPAELYRIVARADGQTVKTFVLPGNDPSFEGALSLRGARHGTVDITLSAIGDRADFPVPTHLGRWRLPTADATMTRIPIEVLRDTKAPRSQASDAPYLQRSGFTLVVSARRLGSFLALYFFIQVTSDPDLSLHSWITGDDGLIGWPSASSFRPPPTPSR